MREVNLQTDTKRLEPCEDDPRADVYYLAEKIGIHRLYSLVVDLRGEPEMRHCVSCGRTANNGGVYPNGRTKCPIEEHYALPKDGYCHLWEKRNVTDDDYPERREE